ncbi:hypothetical protein [Streptomyces sp. NPDC014006]|uniref:hypothetical protein n=1 Tax=Streptomyces sp. NPDC014006 TaxID=3364870 RepID=UPI0036F83630
MFVLGVGGVCCRGVQEWAEAAVQRVEADERVKAMQGVAVDDGERSPVGREEYGEEGKRVPPLVEVLVDPGSAILGLSVAPCPDERDLQLGEFVDGPACEGGEVPRDLVADQ